MTTAQERTDLLVVPAGGTSGGEWAGSYTLPNSYRSPALARMLVRQALGGCPPEVVDTAELLVSELVTNAVLHAQTELLLHISLESGLRISVEDTSVDAPADRSPDPACDPGGERGRGLAVVTALATSWGWERTATGKRAWFEL
jgi:anti-sigma regulatory factor (Ser/Thr protein kinase)